jgi:dihydroneopterin aldolase
VSDTITIRDLEVYFHVGVPEAERANPQRLLITLEIEHDFTAAAATDDLRATLDYFAITERVRLFGNGAQWKLIEALAAALAQMVANEFTARRVTVEVKKFIIPQTNYVSVKTTYPPTPRG